MTTGRNPIVQGYDVNILVSTIRVHMETTINHNLRVQVSDIFRHSLVEAIFCTVTRKRFVARGQLLQRLAASGERASYTVNVSHVGAVPDVWSVRLILPPVSLSSVPKGP